MLARRWVALGAATSLGYAAGAVTVAAVSGHAQDPLIAQAESSIVRSAADPPSRSVLERAAINGMIAALDDRWANYYTPTQFAAFQASLAGSYGGVGIWVRRGPRGAIVVQSVDPSSPAAVGGVRVGDALIAVSGQAVAGRSVASVVGLLRGVPGTLVRLVVDRRGATLRFTLARTSVTADEVSRQMLSPGVELLRVAAFTRGVGAWVAAQAALAGRERLSGLVLDLRGDPGGLLQEAVRTASAFLDGGPVVTYVRRGAAPETLRAAGRGDTTTPLVVLVDGGTASAAEIVAGALQDRGRAVIVGSRTFGKGSVQAATRLANGSAVEVTVGHYLTPGGHSLDGVGLAPDVEVPAGTPLRVVEQRALQVLSGMVALTSSRG